MDNSNAGQLREQVQATAFVAHPYQFPVLGWPSDIESWSHEDLVTYFKTYYAPNNGTMILLGDVTSEKVFALAEKYLQPIPGQDPPEPVRTKEPEQTGERRVVIERQAEVPLILMAWHIGAADDPEAPALRLLMTILTGGESSRIHQRLVEQERRAIRVRGTEDERFDPGLASISATLSAGADIAKAEAIIGEELQKVIDDGVTDAELQKAKNIFLASFWRNLKTINGKGMALGTYEVFHGDYRKLFEAPGAHEKVTREQVQTLAAKVLRDTNRTVGILRAPASETEAAP